MSVPLREVSASTPAAHRGHRADAVPLELVAPARVLLGRRQLPGEWRASAWRGAGSGSGSGRRRVELADVPRAVVEREERVPAGQPAPVEADDDVPLVPLLGGVAAGVPDGDVPAAVLAGGDRRRRSDAYSSGWSSVGTASRLAPGSSGGPFGTAQLFRTPSRSSRRSQCTRSPVRPRGVWCSWTTKVSSFPAGSGCPAGGHRLGGPRRIPLGAVLGERVLPPPRGARARQALRRARLAGAFFARPSSPFFVAVLFAAVLFVAVAFSAGFSVAAFLAGRLLRRRPSSRAAPSSPAPSSPRLRVASVVVCRLVERRPRRRRGPARRCAAARSSGRRPRRRSSARLRAPAAPRRRSAWPRAARSSPRGSRR